MLRLTDTVRKLKPVGSSLESLSYQFLQRCNVSGTAKGKSKVKTGQALKRSKVTVKKGQPAPTSNRKERRGEIEALVDKCLVESAAPVRFLQPKEKAREAEREKMGLISEARKREINNLKKAKSKFDQPMIMGTPGLDLISLGIVDADKIPKYELTVEDGRRLAKEYSRVLMRRHRQRQKAESTLVRLKKEAIEALPEHLKAAALVPDLTPFPANRFMATLTPPIEGYSEKIKEAAKKMSMKEKLR